MFTPHYTITEKLLSRIKEINSIVIELNNKHFPATILVRFEGEARAVSSFASTSIEGNPLPLTEVKRILKSRPQHVRQSEQEVLNYNQALEKLNAQLKKRSIRFDLELILKIQKRVVARLIPADEQGRLRNQPVFVNDPKSRQTIYWPPDEKDVPALMEELIDFVKRNREKIDPLILAGLFHKQFVIIHPFMDGNGRTARLATKVLLTALGLNTFHLFSFENYYNSNVTRYFESVGEKGNYYDLFEKINHTSWLEYFAEGIIDELLRVKKELLRGILTPENELKPYHLKLLQFIREKGYIRDAEYAQLTMRAKATRSLDFRHLIRCGLLERLGKGRATYYILKTDHLS